jgi:hypothetical protein
MPPCPALERERQPPSSSELSIYGELTLAHHCTASSSPAVDLPPEVCVDAIAPHWFGAPRLVVRPPRGLQASTSDTVARIVRLPQASAPLQSLSHPYPDSRANTSVLTLPRFRPPSALPNRQKPPLPDLPRPGLVASSHLPCALTPCSFVGLPGVFQPGSLLGLLPSALRSTEIVLASRHDLPLLCLALPASLGFGPEEPRFARRRFRTLIRTRLHSRGLLPPSHGLAAAGFLRWPRLRLHSWVSSSLRLSPPVPGP